MTDARHETQLGQLLGESGVSEENLEALAGSLVWRIGRLSEDAPITVRVGLASSVSLFNELPRLRNASESELETAIQEDEVRVEWVGRTPA